MKIRRCIGLRKCRDEANVTMIVMTPMMESIEAKRPTRVRVWSCASVRAMANVLEAYGASESSFYGQLQGAKLNSRGRQ